MACLSSSPASSAGSGAEGVGEFTSGQRRFLVSRGELRGGRAHGHRARAGIGAEVPVSVPVADNASTGLLSGPRRIAASGWRLVSGLPWGARVLSVLPVATLVARAPG